MKNLKNFIDESQSINEAKVDKLNTATNFPGLVSIQPGFDETQNLFGILLCPPKKFRLIAQRENDIINAAKQLGFNVSETFTDYAESADVSSDSRDKFTLFAPAGQKETYWVNMGSDTDGVEIVLSMK